MAAHVVSINVGRPKLLTRGQGMIRTAIWKHPVDGPVAARGVNLEGDDQADRSVHGGHDKAIYAYASEDTAWWEAQLGASLGPGAFGENLTVAGLDLGAM
jgi:MOSC domain-containing protein YiiM